MRPFNVSPTTKITHKTGKSFAPGMKKSQICCKRLIVKFIFFRSVADDHALHRVNAVRSFFAIRHIRLETHNPEPFIIAYRVPDYRLLFVCGLRKKPRSLIRTPVKT